MLFLIILSEVQSQRFPQPVPLAIVQPVILRDVPDPDDALFSACV